MSAKPERTLGEPAQNGDEAPGPRVDLRVLEMVALRRRGFGLHQIAELFLLSRERVRQLLLAHGGPDRHDAAQARRRAAERLAADNVGDLLARWRAGESPKEIALALGLDSAACRAAIDQSATEADRYARQAGLAAARNGLTYSDEEIVRALKAAATILGRAPAAREYAALASETDLPSLATVSNRMRGWSNALAVAGLRPVAAVGGRSQPRRWTAEACWEALRRAVDELGEIPTVLVYEQLATGRDDLPSAATIRNRLGRWSSLTARLAAEAELARASELPGSEA